MSTELVSASARSGFALGLSTGVILTSAFFMLWSHVPSHAWHASTSAVTALARQHRVSAERDLTDAVAASMKLLPSAGAAAGTTVNVNGGTGDNRALLASAERHRHAREFEEACAAYAAAARAGPMSADAWADYADAQATLAGRFTGDAEKSIASALALDPRHPKALWLKASLAHEQHDYRVALATWRQLLTVVPPGSSDARIVEANIAEATRLAKG